MLIITAGRFNDINSIPQFEIENVKKIKTLELQKFSYALASEVIKKCFVKKVSSDLMKYIYEKTQGNPFYIEQLCQYLKDSSYLIFDKEKYTMIKHQIEIPDNITSVILTRMDNLPREEKDVVQFSSILGTDFDSNILYSYLYNYREIENELFDKIITNITDKNIFIETDKYHYSFASSLFRDVVYEMQLQSRLKKLHNLAGNTLEKFYRNEESHHYDIATHFYLSGDKNKAISYFSTAGKYFKKLYKNTESLECYEKILKLNPDEKVKNSSMLEKARVNFILGRWEQSITDLVYLIEQVNNLEQKVFLGSLNLLSQIYLYQGNIEKAFSIAFDGLKTAKSGNFDELENTFLLNIAQIYSRKNEYKTAMEMYQKLLKKNEDNNNYHDFSIVLGNIGLIHWNKGEFDKAVECYKKQIQICEKNNDKFGLSVAYLNLGSVLFHKHEVKQSMEYFTKTKYICEEIGYKRVLTSVVGNMGAVYVEWGDIDKAFECYIIKKKMSVELGDRRGLGVAVGNLGTLYMEKGDYDTALEYFEEKKKICLELKDKKSSIYAVMYIGDLHRRKKEYDLAEERYLEAIKICKDIDYRIGILELIGKLGLVCALNGKYKDSLIWIRDTLLMEKKLGAKGYTFYYSIGMCIANTGSDNKVVKEISSLTGLPAETKVYFKHSVDNMKKNINTVEYAIVLEQYGKFLLSIGQSSSGRKNIKKSRDILTKLYSKKLEKNSV